VRTSAKRKYRRARSEIYDEQGGKCALCRRNLKREEATIDHIFPRSLGGAVNVRQNLRVACMRCNSSRGRQIDPQDFDKGCVSPDTRARLNPLWMEPLVFELLHKTALFRPFGKIRMRRWMHDVFLPINH
jgi:hypothetical protein